MKRIKWLFPALILGVALSCTKTPTSALYVPVSSDATATATLAELQQGRTLYIDNCGSCHNLYSPDDYSKTSWTNIMSSMTPKTSLNASQVTLVTKGRQKKRQKTKETRNIPPAPLKGGVWWCARLA